MGRDLVWLETEGIEAEVVNLGAVFSTVRYISGGIEYEILVENEEFEYIDEDE